jgi:hypothetical protein
MTDQEPLFDLAEDAYYECIDRLYDDPDHPVMRRIETPELVEGVS